MEMHDYAVKGGNSPPLLVLGKRGIGKSSLIRNLIEANPFLNYVDLRSQGKLKQDNYLSGYVYEAEMIPEGFKGNILKMEWISC
tara:strand:- start:175 stop:426 length:252 start_codon:yes stop_codon:yes gene_type:complete